MARGRHSQGRIADDQSAWSPLEAKSRWSRRGLLIEDITVGGGHCVSRMPLLVGKTSELEGIQWLA
jgi:hypothetical protein